MTAVKPVEIGGVVSAKPEGQQWSSGYSEDLLRLTPSEFGQSPAPSANRLATRAWRLLDSSIAMSYLPLDLARASSHSSLDGAVLLMDGRNVGLVTNAVSQQCLSTERGVRVASQSLCVRPPRQNEQANTAWWLTALPGGQLGKGGASRWWSINCFHRNLKITETRFEGQP